MVDVDDDMSWFEYGNFCLNLIIMNWCWWLDVMVVGGRRSWLNMKLMVKKKIFIIGPLNDDLFAGYV